MLKTHSKKYRANIRKYIIESIPEEWGNSEKELLAELKSEFDRVANYPFNIQKFPNEIKRLADYLQGIPINLHFNYVDIINNDKILREYDHELSDKDCDIMLEKYWNDIAYNIIRIWQL